MMKMKNLVDETSSTELEVFNFFYQLYSLLVFELFDELNTADVSLHHHQFEYKQFLKNTKLTSNQNNQNLLFRFS